MCTFLCRPEEGAGVTGVSDPISGGYWKENLSSLEEKGNSLNE